MPSLRENAVSTFPARRFLPYLHDRGIQQDVDPRREHGTDESLRVLRACEVLAELVQAEPAVDALQQNAAQERITLDDCHRQPRLTHGERGCHAGASASHHDRVDAAVDHDPAPRSAAPMRSTTSSLPGPCLEICSSGSPVSREMSRMIR